MLYLCEGDGTDRSVRILSPRCFPACLSPQQRDTRSLSAFQKRIKNVYMGIGLKSCVHTYQRTPLGRVIYKWFCRGFAYRRLSRSALGRTPPPSAVFKIIVMGIKKKIEPISDLENLVRIILVWCGKQDWILTARRRSQATLWSDSLRLLQVLFLLWYFFGSKIKTSVLTEVLIWCSR